MWFFFVGIFFIIIITVHQIVGKFVYISSNYQLQKSKYLYIYIIITDARMTEWYICEELWY